MIEFVGIDYCNIAAADVIYSHEQKARRNKTMVSAAILAAIMGAGCIVCIITLYALHRLTGGKMSMEKWLRLNFDF